MRRLLIVLLCTACAGGTSGPAAIDDDVWVATVAGLSAASRQAAGDAGAYFAAREQVLRQHGVTEQDLRDYIAAHGSDLQHLADVWAEAHAAAESTDAP